MLMPAIVLKQHSPLQGPSIRSSPRSRSSARTRAFWISVGQGEARMSSEEIVLVVEAILTGRLLNTVGSDTANMGAPDGVDAQWRGERSKEKRWPSTRSG